MSDNPYKCQCTACQWVGMSGALDNVKDPRGPDEWRVCPQCRTPENLAMVCDEPGCAERVSCGTPTQQGYRSTCHKHAPQWSKP